MTQAPEQTGIQVVLSREEQQALRAEGEVHLTLEDGTVVDIYTGA